MLFLLTKQYGTFWWSDMFDLWRKNRKCYVRYCTQNHSDYNDYLLCSIIRFIFCCYQVQHTVADPTISGSAARLTNPKHRK